MGDLQLKLCKGYLYSNNVQLQPMEMALYFSNELFNRYKTVSGETTLIPYTHIGASDNFWNAINNFLGEPLVNKQFNMYYNATTGYPWGVTEQDMTSTTGFRFVPVTNSQNASIQYKTLDGVGAYDSGRVSIATAFYPYQPLITSTFSKDTYSSKITVCVFPTTLFGDDGKVANAEGLRFFIYLDRTAQLVPTQYKLSVEYGRFVFGAGSWLDNFNINTTQPKDVDPRNPYSDDGDDGGNGPNLDPQIEPTDFPPLPSEGVGDAGLITIYRPTKTQLQNLGAFLWTGLFDLDNFKKLFSNPMDCIIGLGIVPCSPSLGGSHNIYFGNVDSGVVSDYISTQYCKVNCGSVKINTKIGDFLDYEATKVSLFLPYIGFRELSTGDVMGQTITVEYNVDVLSGACAAFVKVGSRGVMYAYNGSCISNVPLTATNYSSAIQNAVSAVASGAGVIAGAVSGAAPITAMSAASLVSSAANTVINSKPNVQRSGNLGGSAGIMSGKTPFVIIERPNYSVPDYYQNYVGRMANKTASLGSLSGFTIVDSIHLDGITATAPELSEIESMLKAGVIL